MSHIQDLQKRANTIRQRYELQQKNKTGKTWSRGELAMGFVGDVGQLIKLVMAEEGLREIADSRQKLEHELSDCLWSVLVLAHKFDFDIEKAFLSTMDELEARLA